MVGCFVFESDILQGQELSSGIHLAGTLPMWKWARPSWHCWNSMTFTSTSQRCWISPGRVSCLRRNIPGEAGGWDSSCGCSSWMCPKGDCLLWKTALISCLDCLNITKDSDHIEHNSLLHSFIHSCYMWDPVLDAGNMAKRKACCAPEG